MKQINGKFWGHYKIVHSSKFRKPKLVYTLIYCTLQWKNASHVLKKSWFSRGPLIWTSDCHFHESVIVLRDFLSSSIQRSQLLTHKYSSNMKAAIARHLTHKYSSNVKAAIARLLRFEKVHEGCAAGLILKFNNRATEKKEQTNHFVLYIRAQLTCPHINHLVCQRC